MKSIAPRSIDVRSQIQVEARPTLAIAHTAAARPTPANTISQYADGTDSGPIPDGAYMTAMLTAMST